MRVRSNAISAVIALAGALSSSPAGADVVGGPEQGQIGFLPTVTGNGDDIVWLHNWILLPVTYRHIGARAGPDRLYRVPLQ